MTPDQTTFALYTCRTCGVELEYQGVGRPPVFCEEHRPASFPTPKHPVRVRQQVNGAGSGCPLPRHRHTDPPTSRDAAGSVPPTAVETRILEAFALFGWLTDPELVEVVEGYGPTIRTARSRLTKTGVLVATGTTRLSPRGRACIVWKRAEGTA